jgi:hypothetical protein
VASDNFDDISDALRHEFILTTSLAIESATKLRLPDHSSRDEHISQPLMDSHRRQQNDQHDDAFMGMFYWIVIPSRRCCCN